MQLQEKHDDVVCISLSLDHKDPATAPSQKTKDNVLKALEDKDVTCQNIIASDGHDKALEHYELTGGLPAVLIYGRDGKLRKSVDAGFEYETDVEPVIVELLAE